MSLITNVAGAIAYGTGEILNTYYEGLSDLVSHVAKKAFSAHFVEEDHETADTARQQETFVTHQNFENNLK